MDPLELVPLEAGLPCRNAPRRSVRLPSHSCHRTPLRLFRLMFMLVVLPSVFIFLPLIMRYRILSSQMYPMSMTDMRLIDSRISPTWCQRQVVKSNITFNAYVVPGPPEITDELVPVTMTRELELEDDMKEYWGFYLLKGSTVTVSSCVRWPGASLIMIKGYKHLHECAYIGDDSSEELDELLEANKLGLLTNSTLMEKLLMLKRNDGKANDPGTMKRHKAGVSFHDPSHATNATSAEPISDIIDHDPADLKEILEHLHALRQAAKIESLKYYHPPSHLISLPALHRHRDTNVDRDERKWISFKDLDGGMSKQVTISDEKTTRVHKNEISNDKNLQMNEEVNLNRISVKYLKNDNDVSNHTTVIKNEKKVKPEKMPENLNSHEVFEDVLKKLQSLGERGKRVLVKLHQSMGMEYKENTSNSGITTTVVDSDAELDKLRQVLVEAIDEERTKEQRRQKRHDARLEAAANRELMLGQIELQKIFNENDEARDYAAEESLEPDGYAEHHEHVNETTAFDMSNSEFWSSFSSSEEALLECEGLILNLPLTPHAGCRPDASESDGSSAAKANALSYRVPANGYYFFVFNSENEVQRNFIRAKFDLQKTRYDVARTALRECRNTTDRCDLLLDIFSSQKVVLEVPLHDNDSLWSEQFLIVSECEPRTSLYLFCVLAVPVLILLLAFQ